MEAIISLCKRRGFIYPGSDIYGGLANTWDYGPYGSQLKKNILDHWWKNFVENREDMMGLDSGILLNPKVWEASGHLANFSDPLMDCKACKNRVRADHLIEEHTNEVVDGKPNEELLQIVQEKGMKCPKCGALEWTEPRDFQMMFKTYQGVIEDTAAQIYMRPETAQGIFVNFKNIMDSTRAKLPFGVGQYGKAFRNEITPGNFIFRTREFEQMEIEYFVHPDQVSEVFNQWVEDYKEWFQAIGIKEDKLRLRQHGEEELSHYSTKTVDFEYEYPFGWGELMGIAHRGCFDLTQHASHSGQKLEYRDPHTNEVFTPHVVEPAIGLTRTVLITLLEAYEEEELENGETRTVMHFDPKIAPVQVAVFPLQKKLGEKAREVYKQLNTLFRCEYDESGAIGKRYRRQDEIGTPICLTIDFDTLEDDTVTLRDRDSMEQLRVNLSELPTALLTRLNK